MSNKQQWLTCCSTLVSTRVLGPSIPARSPPIGVWPGGELHALKTNSILGIAFMSKQARTV